MVFANGYGLRRLDETAGALREPSQVHGRSPFISVTCKFARLSARFLVTLPKILGSRRKNSREFQKLYPNGLK